MAIFKAADVIQFAIRIEENGEKFYRDAERTAKDEATKKLFRRLADEEVAHKTTFQKMFEKSDSCLVDDIEDHEGEYLSYLRSYIDGRAVFEAGATAGGDTRSVLDAAIQRELNSVLYYEGLKEFVREENFEVLDFIIDEERRHFAELSEIKRATK
jgi:rubrerythrin